MRVNLILSLTSLMLFFTDQALLTDSGQAYDHDQSWDCLEISKRVLAQQIRCGSAIQGASRGSLDALCVKTARVRIVTVGGF